MMLCLIHKFDCHIHSSIHSGSTRHTNRQCCARSANGLVCYHHDTPNIFKFFITKTLDILFYNYATKSNYLDLPSL